MQRSSQNYTSHFLDECKELKEYIIKKSMENLKENKKNEKEKLKINNWKNPNFNNWKIFESMKKVTSKQYYIFSFLYYCYWHSNKQNPHGGGGNRQEKISAIFGNVGKSAFWRGNQKA